VVYTMTNSAAGNAILIFDRAANGVLTSVGSIATGGTGQGSGLGSQGALALTADQRRLLAVNAGSNDVTVFAVTPGGLQWRSIGRIDAATEATGCVGGMAMHICTWSGRRCPSRIWRSFCRAKAWKVGPQLLTGFARRWLSSALGHEL
jgi:hypothetical protein